MENREEIRKAIKYLKFHCLPANESTNLYKYVTMAISALEKQEHTNTQSVNSTRTSRPNALESLNILEQAKDDKGRVPMSLVRQAFRNVIEQAVDKSCKTCKHRKLSAWEKPCNRCYFGSGVLKDYPEPYTEEET